MTTALKRTIGIFCLVIGAFMATAVVGISSDGTPAEVVLAEVGMPLFLCFVFTGTGFVTLRQLDPPIFGDGLARRVASTVFLLLAALFSIAFISLLFEGSFGQPSDSMIPLWLALLFGGSGLALRGTKATGSFATNLALVGVAVVVVPLLFLLFVFADSSALPADVLVAAVLLIGVAAGAVWSWSRRAVAPMSEITNVANEIQAGSLDRRIGMQGGAREVQELADSFDQMLDRLAEASSTQQRMIEDASHELRTPIAALSINNEVILDAPNPTLDDYRAATERNQALIERLQATVDELLAEGRATHQQLQQVDNELMAIVARVADQHRVLHPQIPIAVRGPREIRLGIDGPSVQRALENLVENAARYSPPGVPVEIDVVPGEHETLLLVTDHGPGIPPDELDAIFGRYYQGDADADGTSGTAGIGLALVKQVADAHGRIEVISPLVAGHGGTRFTMAFRSGQNDAS